MGIIYYQKKKNFKIVTLKQQKTTKICYFYLSPSFSTETMKQKKPAE